jgi:hypothetical protein
MAEIRELAEAEALGRAAILAKVRELPDPVFGVRWDANSGPALSCRWCGVEWMSSGDLDIPNEPHPQNDCLWALAHAETKESK